MEDNQIIDLYWERKEEAITATNDKYGRYCYSISENIFIKQKIPKSASTTLGFTHGMLFRLSARNISSFS